MVKPDLASQLRDGMKFHVNPSPKTRPLTFTLKLLRPLVSTPPSTPSSSLCPFDEIKATVPRWPITTGGDEVEEEVEVEAEATSTIAKEDTEVAHFH